MCVFCAAVPATVALGAAAKAKQSAAQRDEEHAARIPQWMLALPAEKVALVIIVGLVSGSVVYHSQINPV